MFKKLNQIEMNMNPSDILKWHLILKYGLKEPFLSRNQHSDIVYLGPTLKLNQTYTLIELSLEGANQISLDCLSKLVDNNREIHVLDFKKDVQKIIKKLKKKHKDFDDVIYYQQVLTVLSSKGIEGLNWSDTFNKNQKSFAVIPNILLPYLELISKLDTLIRSKKEVMIAIDGDAASGKTTLSKRIKSLFEANLFHIDDFFQKPTVDPSDPHSKFGSNIDFNRLIDQVITPIKNKDKISYQAMDHQTHQLMSPSIIKYKPVNIIEGSFSMHPKLIDVYDYKIFLTIGRYKQKMRIIHRNGFSSWMKFKRRWIPNEKRYFNGLRIKEQANDVLNTNHLKRLD